MLESTSPVFFNISQLTRGTVNNESHSHDLIYFNNKPNIVVAVLAHEKCNRVYSTMRRRRSRNSAGPVWYALSTAGVHSCASQRAK